MENKDRELIRFAQKAKGYKQALKSAPFARILEVSALLSVLDGFVQRNGLSKKNLVIVDLMAGNGYLTNFLVQSGFKNIHAIEACNEMSFGSDVFGHFVHLHAIPDIRKTSETLKKISPDIIVSMASFHHLIITNENSVINTNESVNLQFEIIQHCMQALPTNGLLLISDIFDDDLLNRPLPTSGYWNTKILENIIPEESMGSELKANIIKAKSFEDFENTVKLNFYLENGPQNPTIHWFRDVVNKFTTIGHDDVALNNKLLDKIDEAYTQSFFIHTCPWIFDDRAHLEDFVSNKFGFARDNPPKIDRKSFSKKIDSETGTKIISSGKHTFGWKLCLLEIKKKEYAINKENIKKTFYKLLFFDLLLAFEFLLIQFDLSDGNLFPLLGKFTFIFAGICIKDLLELL